MAWTAARTWVTGELVTASIMNQQVRDNLDALKAPPSDDYVLDEGSEYSGAGAGWADIDGTNLSLTLVTGGGDVMVHFHGTFYSSVGGPMVYLDVEVDASRTAGDDGICGQVLATNAKTVTFTRLITGLAADTHIFNLQWLAGATVRLAAGSGATDDVHPQFWAREVS